MSSDAPNTRDITGEFQVASPRWYRSVRFRVVAFVAIAMTTIAGSIALAAHGIARQHVRQEISDRLIDVLDSRARLLEAYVEQLDRQAALIIGRERLLELLEAYHAGEHLSVASPGKAYSLVPV